MEDEAVIMHKERLSKWSSVIKWSVMHIPDFSAIGGGKNKFVDILEKGKSVVWWQIILHFVL